MTTLLKLEHSFSKEIKETLQDSCKDREMKYSVNIMCKDGVVSCDHTILASSGNLWKTILMSTQQDTNYVIAPDYNVKFMKAYLLSCVFGHNISETENKKDSRFDESCSSRQNETHEDKLKIKGSENSLEKKQKNEAMREKLENKSKKDDIDSESSLVENVLNEFLEILVKICIEDDEEFKYKDNKADDYNIRYYIDKGKRCPYKISDGNVRFEGFHRKVKKVTEKFKTGLSLDTFKVRKTTCSICLKRFSHPSNCKEHMESMHSEKKKYNCDKCEAKFRTKQGLMTHLENSHDKESKDPFICATCGRVFLYKRSLERHCKATDHTYPQSSSKIEKPKKFKVGDEDGRRCNICHKIYPKHSLEYHMKYYHTDKAREFKCNECNFISNRLDSLTRHTKEVHQKYNSQLSAITDTFKEGSSSYQCTDCKEILKTEKEIEKHLVQKICSLTCNICKKTFSRKHNLKQHMKKIHQSNKQ